MEIDDIYKNISDKINKDILLKWAGKKELKQEDSEEIENFIQEYSKELFSREFNELAEIILSVIYESKDSESLHKLKNEIFDNISEQHPLLFQGMADSGEKPLIFANNILLSAINEMLKNEIGEENHPEKILGLCTSIDFLKNFNPKINPDNPFRADFINILHYYKDIIIDRDWKINAIAENTVENLKKFINITFDEEQKTPIEDDYVKKLYNNSVNIHNLTSSIRKNLIELYQSANNSYLQTKREQDLLWWLNVNHTNNHPEYEFYSYKEFLNPYVSSIFLANDLCEIESLELPLPNKVKALLLESLYKSFPEVLKDDIETAEINVIHNEDYNICPNINNLRNILKSLEKFSDFNIKVKPASFILQILSLVEISKLGYEG
ncbi:hypothetical protein [Acinetobacter lwoffii]|uniref:hypothetical protein n=1 Tax=Acinetobacter lwoffii TaxID=28090 RepID=UPI00209AA005|nr:hypothetical protein [Acinetobacter lwoffii]MCO8063274.1 hypothetical protein [Acinetobacter lwoffii]